jgi:hypothetical protein
MNDFIADLDDQSAELDRRPDAVLRESEKADAGAPEIERQEETTERKREIRKRLTSDTIPNSFILRTVPMRMAAGFCDVLLTNLTPNGSFNLPSFLVVGRVYDVKSEDVRLVTFSRCGFERPFSAVLFRVDDGYLFAIPKQLEHTFFDTPFPGATFADFFLVEQHLPSVISKYVEFKKAVHIAALEGDRLHYSPISGPIFGKTRSSRRHRTGL